MLLADTVLFLLSHVYRWSRQILVVSLVLASGLSAPASFAQTAPTARISAIDTSAFPLIRLRVKFTQNRNAFKPFSPSDVTFQEFGQPVNYTLSCPNNPIAVVLVLDRSLSMAFFPNTTQVDPDSARWRNAKGALTEYIQRMGDQDLAAFIAFAGSVTLFEDFTSNKENLIESIHSVQLGQGTAIWLAGLEAIRRLKVRPERKAVILLTDGADNRSGRTTMNNVLDSARRNGIPFYTVGLGEDVSKTSLDSLSTLSGGRFFFTADGSDLRDIYYEISNSLASDCILEYTTANFCRDSSFHPIRLTYDNGFGLSIADSAFFAPRRLQYASVYLPAHRFVLSGQMVDIPVTFDNRSNESRLTIDLVMPVDPDRIRFLDLMAVRNGAQLRGIQNDVFRTFRIAGTVDIPQDTAVTLCVARFLTMGVDSSLSIPLAWNALSMSGACPIEPDSLSSTTVWVQGRCDRIVRPKLGTRISSVYPNPATTQATVRYRMDEYDPSAHLQVQDAFGRTVLDHAICGSDGELSLTVSSLPSGHYTLVLHHQGGQTRHGLVVTR